MAAKLCTNCGGTGEVLRTRHEANPLGTACETRWSSCKACKGLGYKEV